ncbi:MAG: hypothetical protein LBB11_01315 [Puniceicoccales bacterium]|jgi:hypothetical protein|nr:hypothetical protein [Puniceicoccales bacterium]
MNQRESVKKIGGNALGRCLVSVFIWTMAWGTTLDVKADDDQSPINFGASDLTESFRKKFQIGAIKIDGDDAQVGIDACEDEMSPQECAAFQEAIFRKITSKTEDSLLGFLRDFTIRMQHKFGSNEEREKRSAVYLEVGGGKHIYPELFEKLIIVQDGKIIKNMNCGSRKFVICDDSNIQQELFTNDRLYEAFKRGKAKFFVYHKACNALVRLYFLQKSEFPIPFQPDKKPYQTVKNFLKVVFIGGVCYYLLGNCVKDVKQIGTQLANMCKFPLCMFGNNR